VVSEGLETFSVRLSNPGGGAALGDPSVATVNVTDGFRTVATCDEAGLRAAVTAGGRVTLSCDGTIYLTSPLDVTSAVFLDGAGHAVSISGSNAVRLFNINPGAQLRLLGLTLTGGCARGITGNAGQPGGSGEGGSIYNNGGVLLAEDCRYIGNRAQGGTGGPAVGMSVGPGAGGAARGGVVYNAGGTVVATNCVFALNHAVGGAYGPGGAMESVPGGNGAGGAFFNANGILHLHHCSVVSNSVVSGRGQRYGGRGVNDAAQGGAICSLSGDVTLIEIELARNSCTAAWFSGANGGAISHLAGTLTLLASYVHANQVEGGLGPAIGTPLGWPGGPAFGGSLYVAAGMARIVDSTLADGLALGGPALSYGPGGPGLGGGLYLAKAGLVEMTNCTLSANEAQGGAAQARGDAYGGAVYNSEGQMVFSHVTIAGNSARPGNGDLEGIAQGGGIFATNGSVTLRNSILAYSLSGSNWFGTALVDDGNNLASDASCPLTAPGSLSNNRPAPGATG
jgi:hypothetical protein